ncbi:hypothetical protein DENSPDRAFT_863562 [Dentipellis sp. KUC8613]|nr:hypothetical protein DENSPDRAFT_863562 [Dentipellis sp. KUC8613]
MAHTQAVDAETDGWDTEHMEHPGLQRFVRHVTCVQFRNLTPFPARDALASALSQPSEQSQFTAYGNLSDDLDVALARKRARRVSTTSVGTVKSTKHEPANSDDSRSIAAHDLRGRRRTISRPAVVEEPDAPRSPSSDTSRFPVANSGSWPTVRPLRGRTTSMASTGSHSGALGPSSSSFFPDNSQKTLEKVIHSRLVETFITVTVPPRPPSSSRPHARTDSSRASQSPSPQMRAASPPHSAPSSREQFPSTGQKVRSPGGISSRRNSRAGTSTGNGVTSPPKGSSTSRHQSSMSVAVVGSSGRSSKTASGSPKVNGGHTKSSMSASHAGHFPSPSASLTFPSDAVSPSVPNYISPIHEPSINPSFPLDPRSNYEFAKWTDLSSTTLNIQVWGNVDASISSSSKGKGKGKAFDLPDTSHPLWRVMEEWSIHLSDLVPLPDELAKHPSHLPPNTVLITLSPPGRVYYLPRPSMVHKSRSPSPLAGYSSDPEVRSAGDLIVPYSVSDYADDRSTGSPVPPPPKTPGTGSRLRHDHVKSAGWQDLVRLVTLQSVILDTRQSLAKVVHDIDSSLLSDEAAVLRREVSEREARVSQCRSDTDSVRMKSEALAERLNARREALEQRRQMLAQARDLQEQAVSAHAEGERELAEERDRTSLLHNRLGPVRITLVATLASIFPIDLLSGPDLLYTVLSVPLPIPLGATDPAPPLSLPSHKEVTEDAIATALGYAALVVQLLAVYLDKGLVYPITYIGSKSLIRDGISAMVGPRMFPLFSKGVDTYRFEYGVFLLNKDIELLMSDRNLRALDMRHTLPNLKNLLLTLTDGEGVQLIPPRRAPASPLSSISGLESPSRPSSPAAPPASASASADATADAKTTDTNGASAAEAPATSPSPTTPTPASASASNDTSYASLAIMSKPFFGLSGFLRSRYPSSSQQPSVKAVPEVPEGEPEAAREEPAVDAHVLAEAVDEEDRRTVRGLQLDADGDSVVVEDHDVGERKDPVDGDASANGLVARPRIRVEPVEKLVVDGAHAAEASEGHAQVVR